MIPIIIVIPVANFLSAETFDCFCQQISFAFPLSCPQDLKSVQQKPVIEDNFFVVDKIEKLQQKEAIRPFKVRKLMKIEEKLTRVIIIFDIDTSYFYLLKIW